jgi:hypothetical protein
MPKLAIYIPKKDLREIEQWRRKLNFSQIFMKALRQEIRERSRMRDASDDQLTRAAEHYRHVLIEDCGCLTDIGYDLGCTQVLECVLTPGVIRQMLKLNDAGELQSADLEEVAKAMGGRQTLTELARGQGVDDQTHPTWRQSICGGYVKGVADAWARVCEQIRAGDSGK